MAATDPGPSTQTLPIRRKPRAITPKIANRILTNAGSLDMTRFSKRDGRALRWLFLVLILGHTATGCNSESAENRSTEKWHPFDTMIKGMPAGTVDYKARCVSFETLSVEVVDADTERKLTAYRGSGCQAEKRLGQHDVPADLRFAGAVADKLVFDEGTDVNSRNIVIKEPDKAERIRTLDYALEPEFSEGGLVYFQPQDTEVNSSECPPEQKEMVADWKRFGMPIMLAKKVRYDLQKNSIQSTDEIACYALQ